MPPPSASRKFMYPEQSVPYSLYIKRENPDDVFAKLWKPASLQLEERSTFLKVGALATVKGSAYMEYGNTKVMASIEPPRELSKQTRKIGTLGIVTCTLKYAPFAVKDPSCIPRKETSMALALKKALEPAICRHEFPYFQLEIKVIILDDDGCALSTAINCCGAALVDAGIATYDLITASTVCKYRDVEFVNPNAVIEQLVSTISDSAADEEHGIVVTASLAAVDQITECFQKGYFKPETLKRLTEHTLTLNERILDTLRYVLINKVKQQLEKQKAMRAIFESSNVGANDDSD
ncbi:exosome complex component MTR3-like [Rhagoletis pomonella]|uniref:exosome complex component MTR3 n=1 Tax=Rhagoletis pomonella TaxID=28610 RepID=UPI00177C678B|nr:exosome complex component MTR3 [Rhagoletis pomonella]XP_036326000.1 exosome complex component MTR3-like [Rhagoletis pomonella]